jgi:hypothetical protein
LIIAGADTLFGYLCRSGFLPILTPGLGDGQKTLASGMAGFWLVKPNGGTEGEKDEGAESERTVSRNLRGAAT